MVKADVNSNTSSSLTDIDALAELLDGDSGNGSNGIELSLDGCWESGSCASSSAASAVSAASSSHFDFASCDDDMDIGQAAAASAEWVDKLLA